MFFNFVREMRKRRRKKSRKKSRKWEKVDRLSSLPDDILVHILSFLPTKIYVATSILGRRWRLLWPDVPNLDFNVDEDLPHQGDDSSIIDWVMYWHERQNISSFRLCVDQEPMFIDFNDLKDWILTAVECNVQKLDLSIAWELELPECIFTCKTLVHLRLARMCMPTIRDITVYLPSLKTLRLHRVHFSYVECFHHLLSGCPVLNELFMTKDEHLHVYSAHFFFPEDSEFSCISSPTINRLELHKIKGNARKVFRVKLDTPTLKYLKLQNYAPYFSHEVLSEDFSKVHRFAFFASTETFHNLKELELEEADWRFVPSFLEKANNLEVLTIGSYHGDENPTYWIDPKQVPSCLVLHLGTVIIRDFCCAEQEYNVVKYILRNAKVLKRMEIYHNRVCYYRMDVNEQLEAVERITLFERVSEACQLAFHP